MVKREELDGQNNVKYYILSRYDEQERLIEEAWYNPDDSLDKRDRLIYDSPDLSELTPSSEEKYIRPMNLTEFSIINGTKDTIYWKKNGAIKLVNLKVITPTNIMIRIF
jgi:hypothetical protein